MPEKHPSYEEEDLEIRDNAVRSVETEKETVSVPYAGIEIKFTTEELEAIIKAVPQSLEEIKDTTKNETINPLIEREWQNMGKLFEGLLKFPGLNFDRVEEYHEKGEKRERKVHGIRFQSGDRQYGWEELKNIKPYNLPNGVYNWDTGFLQDCHLWLTSHVRFNNSTAADLIDLADKDEDKQKEYFEEVMHTLALYLHGVGGQIHDTLYLFTKLSDTDKLISEQKEFSFGFSPDLVKETFKEFRSMKDNRLRENILAFQNQLWKINYMINEIYVKPLKKILDEQFKVRLSIPKIGDEFAPELHKWEGDYDIPEGYEEKRDKIAAVLTVGVTMGK